MAQHEVLKDVPIDQVKLNPDNPRVNEQAVPMVAKSLKQFGYRNAITVDENMIVLSGNTRYKAMLALGWATIPEVIKISGWTQRQKDEYIVADNKTHEFSDWDFDKLQHFGEDIMQQWGFSSNEIDKALNKDPNTIVQPDVREVVDIKPGDLFEIGRHRLICGDATQIETYRKLFTGTDQKAQMIWTDPPYNVAYEGSRNTRGTNQREQILNDDMSAEDFSKFLTDALACMMQYCDSSFYICMGNKELRTLHTAFKATGGHFQSFLVWVKNTFTLGGCDWQSQYELILYGWNGKIAHQHYFAGFRDEGDVWEGLDTFAPERKDGKTMLRLGEYHIELDSETVTGKIVNMRDKTDIWRENKHAKNKFHNNEKPFGLIKKAIEASSQRGRIVMDPFCGGGSCMLTAHGLNRTAYCAELDPQFVDVILRRMIMLDADLPVSKNGEPYDKSKLYDRPAEDGVESELK